MSQSELALENEVLREKIKRLEEANNMDKKIDDFVDKWFEENKDMIDIGEIEICGRYKIDIIPDEIEKRIYQKVLKILIAFIARGII